MRAAIMLALAYSIGGIDAGAVRAEEQKSASYVGRINDTPTSVRIGLVVTGDKSVLAYVCSSNQAFNEEWSGWFKGEVSEGRFQLETNGIQLTGTVSGGTVTGTFGKSNASAFSAKLVDPEGLAGLYRAVYSEDGDDYVAGWIVDEEDHIVGSARSKKGKVTTDRKAGNGAPSARAGKGNSTAGQRVQDANNPPNGKAVEEPSAEDREESLAAIVARATSRGGNPLLGAVVHSAKRLLAGTSPVGELEKKAFAELKKLPKAILKNYVKNWDELPVGTRGRLAGAVLSKISSNQPLTLKTVISAFQAVKSQQASISHPPHRFDPSIVFGLTDPFGGSVGVLLQDEKKAKGVSSVRMGSIKCVDPTGLGKGGINPDEIFMSTVVTSGDVAFDLKSSVYKFKKGDSRALSAADGKFWPGSDSNEPATEDIIIAVGLFEDDAEDLKKIPALIKSLTKSGTEIASVFIKNPATKTTVQEVAALAEGLVDGIAAALPETQFLGTQTIVVTPNGQVRDPNGKPIRKLTFLEKRRNGSVKFHYEATDIKVK